MLSSFAGDDLMEIPTEDRSLGLLAATLGAQARVFHTGFVVRDLDGAMRLLGEALGVDWAKPLEVAGIKLRTRDGGIEVPEMRLTYSAKPAHVELIQEVPGSLWVAESGLRGHHVGMWTDDLAGEVERLEALGLPLHTHGLDAAGELATFAYHEPPLGLYIELVDASAKSFYPQWFAQATGFMR
jgi:hypothetical protein